MSWFTRMAHGRIDMLCEGLKVDLLYTIAEEKLRYMSKSALW
jgi:hypothetical protein